MNNLINELVSNLKKNSSLKVCKSIDIINSVCKEIHNMKGHNFSIRNVGARSSSLGGPAEGAIRNTSGEKYRTIIASWKNQSGTSLANKSKNTLLPDWINDIHDLTLKSMVLDLYAEKKKLLSEIACIRQHLKPVTIDMRPSSNKESSSPNAPLTQIEVLALKHAISKEMFLSRGWKLDVRGQVLDHNNRTVFKPGYVTSIEKILELVRDL